MKVPIILPFLNKHNTHNKYLELYDIQDINKIPKAIIIDDPGNRSGVVLIFDTTEPYLKKDGKYYKYIWAKCNNFITGKSVEEVHSKANKLMFEMGWKILDKKHINLL